MAGDAADRLMGAIPEAPDALTVFSTKTHNKIAHACTPHQHSVYHMYCIMTIHNGERQT